MNDCCSTHSLSCIAIVILCLLSAHVRCLNAVIVVALSQGCEGGEKRWYTSTMELQLASLEICRACRSVPSLSVRVEPRTPVSLWHRASIHTGINARISKESRLSSRVPVVRALRLVWTLPAQVLEQSAAIELWQWSSILHLRGSVFARSVELLTWPRALKELVVDADEEVASKAVPLPPSLERLRFGDTFNQPVAGIIWPPFLKLLSFGCCFDQPIHGVVWPASLQQLSF